MQIVIFDPVTPLPYSLVLTKSKSIGGTEATVIRIAEALDAIVIQHNRSENENRYRTPDAVIEPDHLIVLREAQVALELAAKYPAAKKYLWLHDLADPSMDRGRKLQSFGKRLAVANVTIVCVSRYHAEQVRANFASFAPSERPEVTHVYNPVNVCAVKGYPEAFDPNKLVFFSSPHKGLEYACSIFSRMHAKNSDLQLFIANPGYMSAEVKAHPGIVNIGAVPHDVILEHVRSAMCTFYPNYVYPETFGLALAESNAVGTPVLTHGIGAAPEVLNGFGQIIEVPRSRAFADSLFWRFPKLKPLGESALLKMGCSDAYVEKISEWQLNGRPLVAGREEFSLAAVSAAWLALFATKT